LTCIDWLGDGLRTLTGRPTPDPVRRDESGRVRLIEARLSYGRIVDGAFDKIRQAGRGMPAVTIRQLESLIRIVAYTTSAEQRSVLGEQAEMLLRSSVEAIPEARDRDDVRTRYDRFARARVAAEQSAVVADGDRSRGRH
jgi:uncharacterized membrane protein